MMTRLHLYFYNITGYIAGIFGFYRLTTIGPNKPRVTKWVRIP